MSEHLLSSIQFSLPVETRAYKASGQAGLVIIDEVNGFCTTGAGNLAPPVENAQVVQMVDETDSLAKAFVQNEKPVLAFLDTHIPGKPEPPYPPHCEQGTGEENLVPELLWLQDTPHATLFRKDCINAFIGAMDVDTGQNAFLDWIKDYQLTSLVFTGICTDICVMDAVLTLLSARNHGLCGPLEDIVVLEKATSTYDLPRHVAENIGLPASAAHPQDLTHHLGLYFMASRGAIIASEVTGI